MRGRFHGSLRRWCLTLATVATLPGCGPTTLADDTTTDQGSNGTTSSDPPITPPPPIATTTTSTADGDTTGDGIAFVDDPDFGSSIITGCSVLTQNCPAGLKCEPWSNDGGSWNDTRCSPIADEPGRPGDPCTVDGGPYSGIDDCELGAMCFDVDPETNTGTCFAHCVGINNDARCDDPHAGCPQRSEEVLYLCHPTCDPLAQDCARGEGCYPVSDFWLCAPEAPDAGGYGAPCECLECCAAGLMCLHSSTVPGCTNATGCCSEICDLDAPACTGAPEGQTCQSWYAPGQAEPGLENVGACALPG